MKKELLKYTDKIGQITYLLTMLRWEMDTKAPVSSYEYLINTMTSLESELFNLETSEEYINLINNLINSDEYNNLKEEEKIFLNYLKEEYYKFKKVPKTFYLSFSKLRNE